MPDAARERRAPVLPAALRAAEASDMPLAKDPSVPGVLAMALLCGVLAREAVRALGTFHAQASPDGRSGEQPVISETNDSGSLVLQASPS